MMFENWSIPEKFWSTDHQYLGHVDQTPTKKTAPVGDSGPMAYSVTGQILFHRMIHGPNTLPKRTHHVWAKTSENRR